MAALAGVRESRATFVEEKSIAALAEPLVSRGTLAYDAPDRLEKRTTEPVEERVVVEGGKLTYSRPGEGEGGSFSLDRAPELRGLVEAVRGTFAGDLEGLRRYYSVGLEGTTERWRLTLVPVDERVKAVLKVVRIDGEARDVRRVETVEADGDLSRMTVRQVLPAR